MASDVFEDIVEQCILHRVSEQLKQSGLENVAPEDNLGLMALPWTSYVAPSDNFPVPSLGNTTSLSNSLMRYIGGCIANAADI